MASVGSDPSQVRMRAERKKSVSESSALEPTRGKFVSQ
jgi:hypothetical protein